MVPKFIKDKYLLVPEAIPRNLADFVYTNFLLKRLTSSSVQSNQTEWGEWGDDQCANTYVNYSDIAMETLLVGLKSKIEKLTGLSLWETYSYARCYKHNDILKSHTDRGACAVSCTLHLGGDKPWPLYLKDLNNQTKKINFKPGDMLLYKGAELEHWREPYTGDRYVQTFLHYVTQIKENEHLKFDGRPHLGLPLRFKKDKK